MYIFLSKCTYLYSLTFSTTTIISSLLCQKGKRYVPWLEITERHFYAFRKWTPLSFQMASDSGWWVGSSCRKFGSGGLPILPVGRSCQKNEIRIIITQHFPENLYIFPELDFTKLSTYFTLKFGDPPNSSLTPGWKWNKEGESFFMFCPCVSKKEDKKRVLPLVYFVSCSVQGERQRQRRRQIKSVSPVVWIVSCSVPGCQLQAEEDIACPATKQNILINLYEGGAKTEIKSG